MGQGGERGLYKAPREGGGKKEKEAKQQPGSFSLRAKLDKLFGNVTTSRIHRFGEGLGSTRMFLSPALLAAGKVPREGAGKDGGGRPLLSARLLTKQFCQLAVGAAWGFAIELLEGGGGCAGEGREGPALLQPLLLPRPRGREAWLPWARPRGVLAVMPERRGCACIPVCLGSSAVP